MKARNLLLPMGMVLAIVAPACTTAQDASTGDLEAVKAQFVGHYELVIYESFRPNGEVVDMNYIGRILYDEHDNMSAIGMPKDLPARARESSELVQGGFAYWGKVSFDVFPSWAPLAAGRFLELVSMNTNHRNGRSAKNPSSEL